MKPDQVQFIETTHSTNVTLRENLSIYLRYGFGEFPFYTIYTHEQTDGKGLGSNKWLSQYGENLLISFLFQPLITVQNQFYFNQYFAISVRHFLAQYVNNPLIKWPNDIYVGNKKIAGILIEHGVQGDSLTYSIAGVGININQTHFEPELPNPTSVALITGEKYPLGDMISQLTTVLNDHYHLILNEDFSRLQEIYLNHLFQYQKLANYLIKGKEYTGTITGLSPFGQLIIQTESKKIFTCNFKEVQFILSGSK